jgi:hypothetical protein
MKYISLLFIFLFFSCNDSSDLLPCEEIVEIGENHCYPFNVRVYQVKGFDYSKFLEFPKDDFCSDDDRYSLCKWVKFTDLTSLKQKVWIKRLGDCDRNKTLQTEIKLGNDIYFAGCYKLIKGRNNNKVENYYKVLFFNKDSMKLYIFKHLDHYPFF